MKDATATSLTTNIAYSSLYDTDSSATYDKLRVWHSSSYTIGMMDANTFGDLNDYAMTYTMGNGYSRGFLWRDAAHSKSEGAMSLSLDGKLAVLAEVTSPKINIGSSKEASMVYNPTTSSIDFIIN